MEETLVMNRGGIRALDSQIGVQFEESFYIEESCFDALQEIIHGLETEDVNTRFFRTQLFCYGIVRKSLVPLLLHLDDDENEDIEDKVEILYSTIKIFAQLTQTLDVLIPNLHVKLTAETPASKVIHQELRLSRNKIVELKHLKKSIHESVTDMKQYFLETDVFKVAADKVLSIVKEVTPGKLSMSECEALCSLLYMYRNLLYLPDTWETVKTLDGSAALDSELVEVLFDSGLDKMVLYCASCPQREKFTLPLIQLLTLLYKDTEKVFFEPGEFYRQVCDDDAYTDQGTLFLSTRMKPLLESLIENDWTWILYHIKRILVKENHDQLSSIYYSWNVGFYLKVARHFRLPFSAIRGLFSVYCIDYLVYVAISNYQKLQNALKRGHSYFDAAKELNQAVAAVDQIFITTEYYWQGNLNNEERHHMLSFLCLLTQSQEISQMFLVLLRNYQPDILPVSHICQVVRSNHTFLSMADLVTSFEPDYQFFDMKEHIASYATRQVVLQYSHILGLFGQCPNQTIEEVLVMIGHIGIDLGNVDVLLQLPLLEVMCHIEANPHASQLSMESRSVVRYVISEFYSRATTDPSLCASTLVSIPDKETPQKSQVQINRSSRSKKEHVSEWSETELEELQEICVKCEDADDFTEAVTQSLHELGLEKDVTDIIQQLETLGWISDTESQMEEHESETNSLDEHPGRCQFDVQSEQEDTSISFLVSKLCDLGHKKHVQWLHKTLLEVVYIHLGGMTLGKPFIEEPVLMNYIASGKSIPLVAYTEDEAAILQNTVFKTLLQSLGFHPAEEGLEMHPRIPQFWHLEDLQSKAQSILVIDYTCTKYSPEDLENYLKKHQCDSMRSIKDREASTGTVKKSSNEDLQDTWMLYIKKLGKCNEINSTSSDTWWDKFNK